jgi:hypothetical protein
MLNVYLTYVSSLETGDVEISDKVYISHGKAVDDIESMIQQYVSNRKCESSYKIVSNEDFEIKKLNKDATVPIGGYVFRHKKGTVYIYKKVIVEGRVWNGTKIQKVGKIGVLPEINIPVDRKLLKLIEEVQENSHINNGSIEERNHHIPLAPLAPEINNNIEATPDDDKYCINVAYPSNYEHGKHVSFIQELKYKLQERNKLQEINKLASELNINPKEVETDNNHLEFVNSLRTAKANLNHITPPLSPILGRVLENTIEHQLYDFPSIPNLPPCPPSPELSSELSMSSDWDTSSEELISYETDLPCVTDTNVVYGKHIIPSPPKMDYTPDHIEKIVENIIKTINLNNNKESSAIRVENNIDTVSFSQCLEYDEISYEDTRWNLDENKENIWSDRIGLE